MALMLECICSPNSSLCNLTQVTWMCEVISEHFGSISATHILSLESAVGSLAIIIDPTTGIYSNDIPVHLAIANWSSLANSLYMNASLFQVPFPLYSQYEELRAKCALRLHYQCVNLVTGESTVKLVVANPNTIGDEVQCKTGEDVRGKVVGGLYSIFYKSTPLGSCLSGGIAVQDTEFLPLPEDQTIDIGDSSQICLCATGGSGSYEYSIVEGSLPCGMNLNTETGCLEGEPDGTCDGTHAVTFRVTDIGAGDASETGGTVGGVTIGGTCRVFGDGVTRISGGAWTSDMVGQHIFINSITFTIGSVTPPDNITLTSTYGIFDPAAWSYTSPVTDAPPPAPPNTADVTCGLLPGCPTGDLLGGNNTF